MREINLITNEKVSINNKNYSCDNVEIKTIILGLKKKFKINFFCRESSIKRQHRFELESIILSKNIFIYLKNIFFNIKKKNLINFVISITPYTFIASIILLMFNKKIFLYLRSNGFEEYKIKFGFFGYLIYFFMFLIMSKYSKIITNNNNNLRTKKATLVIPSMLDNDWKKNINYSNQNKIKLLYIGRFKKEKGVYSLIKIFKKIKKKDINLTIVGLESSQQYVSKDSRIKFKKIVSNKKKLINLYNKHSIFILPSFTEAYGMVIDEALSRLRPVIIFDEIKNVVKGRKGIFISKRNHKNLHETIELIVKNYKKIQKEIKKNNLPNKTEFTDSLVKFLLN